MCIKPIMSKVTEMNNDYLQKKTSSSVVPQACPHFINFLADIEIHLPRVKKTVM